MGFVVRKTSQGSEQNEKLECDDHDSDDNHAEDDVSDKELIDERLSLAEWVLCSIFQRSMDTTYLSHHIVM